MPFFILTAPLLPNAITLDTSPEVHFPEMPVVTRSLTPDQNPVRHDGNILIVSFLCQAELVR
jgi:hypothetical protein